MKSLITVFLLTMSILYSCGKSSVNEASVPKIVTIPEQKLLCLRTKGPYQKMNQAFGQTYMLMNKLSLQPAGTSFAIYYNDPAKNKPADYDWEVCVPVNKKAEPSAPVKFRIQKQTEAVSLIYTGPYGTKEHSAIYNTLMTFGSKLSGYKFSGPPREVYIEIKGFRGGKKNVTQIYFPIAKK